MLVVIRGAGDIASGIALRLFRAGMRVVMCDLPVPTSIRRTVCFSEAIRLGETSVEGVRGVLCATPATARAAVEAGDIAVLADPEAACARELSPDVLVDAILAKRNLGTTRDMAPVVIGVGPGFTAPVDCDAAVETMRGHYLGRVYYEGSPLPNTAVPGLIGGYAGERVMRAPADGVFEPCVEIGAEVRAGDVCATVAGEPMRATIDGVVRGLLQAGVRVTAGMKSGDVDPRCRPEYIRTVSDKASAVGGGVLEAILALSGKRATGAKRNGQLSDALAEKNVRPLSLTGEGQISDVSRAKSVRKLSLDGSLSDKGFVSALAAELAAGRSVGLATLLATRGSMPRHEGARMAVLASGAQMGTVGGGALERLAIERAAAARRDGSAGLEWVTSGASDMACGGDALLAVRALTARELPVLLALQDALERDEPVTVEERWADASAPELLLAPAERVSRPTWDAASATYHEPVCAPSRLHVFGAGHVGAALVGLAGQVGFEVRVYDDRPELASGASLTAAASVTCGPFDELAAGATIGPLDSVVVLTHGHAHDEAVLLAVLTRDVQPAYVGCIGSRRKAALTRERLAAAGVPRERTDAVHLPIGEAIGAVTPSEIAVSIVAQLVRCRAERREGKDGDANRGRETT